MFAPVEPNIVTSSPGYTVASLSCTPNREPIRQCREAMRKQNELYEASLAAKRLNFEMSRAKTCHDNYKNGIRFKEGTPMAKLCEDIEMLEFESHTHKIEKKP